MGYRRTSNASEKAQTRAPSDRTNQRARRRGENEEGEGKKGQERLLTTGRYRDGDRKDEQQQFGPMPSVKVYGCGATIKLRGVRNDVGDRV